MSKIDNIISLKLNSVHLRIRMEILSRHMAAAASEIELVDNKACPGCGSLVSAHSKTPNGRHVFCACPDCDYTGFHKAKYFECDTDWRSEKVGVAWNAREHRPVDHAK